MVRHILNLATLRIKCARAHLVRKSGSLGSVRGADSNAGLYRENVEQASIKGNAEADPPAFWGRLLLLGKRAISAPRSSAGVMMMACIQEEDWCNTGQAAGRYLQDRTAQRIASFHLLRVPKMFIRTRDSVTISRNCSLHIGLGRATGIPARFRPNRCSAAWGSGCSDGRFSGCVVWVGSRADVRRDPG